MSEEQLTQAWEPFTEGISEPEVPMLVVLSGLPGVGKSVVANELVHLVGAERISSDLVREELFPEPMYSAEESKNVYEECRHRALRSLTEAGRSAVFDATNLGRSGVITSSIDGLADQAAESGFGVIKASLTASRRALGERIEGRLEQRDQPGLAPAGWVVVERMRLSMPGAGWTYFDTTDSSPHEVARAIVDAVRNQDGGSARRQVVPVTARFVTETVAPMVPPGKVMAALERQVTQCLALQEIGASPEVSPAMRSQSAESMWNAILTQIDHDALDDELLDSWGCSTLINDDPDLFGNRLILPERLASALLERGCRESELPVAHAGVLHTYGYLLSTLETPYGMKRSRWVNGEIARAVGVTPALFGAIPPLGTLLRNATALALHLVGEGERAGELAPWMEPPHARVHASTVDTASDENTGHAVIIRTFFAARDAADGVRDRVLLIYAIEAEGVSKLITMFPMSHSAAREELTGPAAQRLRFNAAMPVTKLAFDGKRTRTGNL